jgi:DNA repair protein SbcC/Rad50
VILAKLYLSPLGAFSKKLLEFAPGMNVVLGPNEAGKSTLFNAARLVLLVSTDLGKRDRERLIGPYLPVTGGDFVRVAVELHKGGEVFKLTRRWGNDPSSKLDLPGGGSLAEEARVREKLAEILPARLGTMEHVLMTRQSMLGSTLESFRTEARESIADLSDILRRAVLETGGVSVDRFLERVKSERDQAFLRWDRQSRGPEKSKGTTKRWVKGFGTVLGAWYELDGARELASKARAWESELDSLKEELRRATSDASSLKAFLESSEAPAQDAQERRSLEAELRSVKAEADALGKVMETWPVAADRARKLEQSLSGAEEKRRELAEEQRRAKKAEEARLLRDRHARVMRFKKGVDDAQAALKSAPRLDKKALAGIQAAVNSLNLLEAGLEAGKISVTVAGRSTGELLTQEDFSPEKKQGITPGRTVSLAGTGRIRIIHKDLEIEVRSGDADAQARTEKAAAARRARDELMKKHAVGDLEEAGERNRQWEKLTERLAGAEESLSDELAGESLEGLAAAVAAAGELAPARGLQEVTADLARFQNQEKTDRGELAELQRQVKEWEAAHLSLEKLVLSLASAKGKEGDLQARISRASALPAGFTDADGFLRAVAKARADLGEQQRRHDVFAERARNLEEQAREWGGQSAEELSAQVANAQEAFDAELRRAEALDRVAERGTALLGSTNGDIASGLTTRLSEMLSAMTAGRHSALVMDGPLPAALSEGDGVSLGWDQLSAGTRDTLALALRLAMADYFLGKEDGFMLLDDPLVDMDPERQKAAAAALKVFAGRRQLIVFTCHPATAALLGAKPIMLATPSAPSR